MPAKSRAEQGAAGVALAAKRGTISPRGLKGPARHMYEEMSERELEHMAGGSMRGKPEHVRPTRPRRGH